MAEKVHKLIKSVFTFGSCPCCNEFKHILKYDQSSLMCTPDTQLNDSEILRTINS